MSTLARVLLAHIEGATRVGDFGAVRRRADQARIPLRLEQIKRLDDRNWATQLLAAGNSQKGHAQKRR